MVGESMRGMQRDFPASGLDLIRREYRKVWVRGELDHCNTIEQDHGARSGIELNLPGRHRLLWVQCATEPPRDSWRPIGLSQTVTVAA